MALSGSTIAPLGSAQAGSSDLGQAEAEAVEEDEGREYPSLLPYVSLLDYSLEFLPLAPDVLSLELGQSWRQIYDQGDHTSLFYAAQALMTMQHAFGLFPRILGKGDLAARLCSLLLRQRREHITLDPTNPALTRASTTMDSLIIIDRAVDLASPLCSQLTYEGLLDEMIGIEAAHIQVPADDAAAAAAAASSTGPSSSTATAQQAQNAKRKKHHLDIESDRIHAALRDENFAVVGSRLHEMAKRLNAEYESRHAARTVPQMRAFVGRLQSLETDRANLALHTRLAQQIMRETTSERFAQALEVEQNLVAGLDPAEQLNAIEDMINMELPLKLVLRLLCLCSVVGGGLKPKNLEYIKRELLQTYGYQYLPLLLKLEKVGLLTRATPTSSRSNVGFAGVRRSLKLINDDVDEQQPRDISYVYSGYAPLSVRLVQTIAQKEAFIDTARRRPGSDEAGSAAAPPKAHPIIGWRGFEDVIASLPGATVDETQAGNKRDANAKAAPSSTAGVKAAAAAAAALASDPDHITTTVVFFIGGVTHAEIAALRFMSRQSRNRRFLICTTQTINGTSMLDALAGEHVSIGRGAQG